MRQEKLLCHKKKFKPVTPIPIMVYYIYLAVVLDLCSRKCIGWELSRSIRSDLAMNAPAKALKNRTTESIEGLIHHSVEMNGSLRPNDAKSGEWHKHHHHHHIAARSQGSAGVPPGAMDLYPICNPA
jgi:hypothetical protein